MFDYSVIGKAAPTYPCARGIRASLHILDVRLFNLKDGQAPVATSNNKEVAV
jgi:hypothetical protein